MPRAASPASSTPAPDAAARPASRGPRAVLVAGVVLTVLATLALLGSLLAYALGTPGSPLLFRVVLFGYPLGFGLMILHLVLAGIRRGRV